MGTNGVEEISMVDEVESSETTIEIKIKTLDSQTYTLRVDKQMPVPALKEQIAYATGVLSEQQRLICRGKVLKDDQLLSAYHVEDGHTLHLVTRQPVPSSTQGLANHPATDSVLSTNRGQDNEAAPSFVIETFHMPDHVDGVPPEFSQIVSAVLGSLGTSNVGSGNEGGDVRGHGPQRLERSTQLRPEQPSVTGQSDRLYSSLGLPTAVALGPLPPPVIPDSLTTLSQYLSHVRRDFDAIARAEENDAQAATYRVTGERESNAASHLGTVQGLPTPASLAEVMCSTRQMLIEQAGECLSQFTRQLENQVNVTDPSARSSIQSRAWRTGVLFHNLGAFLLELGRTIMTLRLGQTPSDAVVNAGPAVFISPSGPNPLMVQPLPIQPTLGTSFSNFPLATSHPGSGLVNRLAPTFLPRRIDIQIRRGSSTSTPNLNREEPGHSQQSSGQRDSVTSSGNGNLLNQAASRDSEAPSFAGDSGVRIVPIRTMVAAVPGSFSRLPSDSSSNSLGFYCPVLGRVQHVASGDVSGERGLQASAEHRPPSIQTEQQPILEPAMPQQNVEDSARDGSLPATNLRQQEPSNGDSFNANILPAGRSQNNQESERQIPSSVMQLLRTLFPGEEIHDARLLGTATITVPEHAGTSSGAVDALEAETPRVSDEGILLSNLLRQILPVISQHVSAEPNVVSPEASASEHRIAPDSSTQAENSDVGTSRRKSDLEPSPPSSKRQKKE